MKKFIYVNVIVAWLNLLFFAGATVCFLALVARHGWDENRKDLALEGKTGFLFPSEDEDALRALLGDAKLRERMGNAGRRVEKIYSWQREVGEYLGLRDAALEAG